MAKRPKYDSSRDRENYTFHPGKQFNLEYLPDPGPCYLFALDHRQATMLRRMLSVFPKYHWVWGLPSPRKDWDAATWQLWEDISDLVDETEACLVSGCDMNDLVKAIRELTAVVGGHARDFTIPIPDNVDYTSNGLVPQFIDLGSGANIGDSLHSIDTFIALSHAELLIMSAAQALIASNTGTINSTLNETLQTQENGGLPDNINERLRNLNISLGGFIDGVDLIGIAESLSELNKIRNALESTVIVGQGVERQGLATIMQENTDNISFILDRIRDNLDVSIFDAGSGQIKEYSLTMALYTRLTEFIEVADKIRDNLDTIIDEDMEIGLGGLLDAMNLTQARVSHSLRCVADALNAACPDTSSVAPPYSGLELRVPPHDDFEAALQEIRDDLIDDEDEGRAPLADETDEDLHIADGTIVNLAVEHFSGSSPDTGYLLIDVTTDGKCELVFNVQGTSRTMITTFIKPQEQVQMRHVPDTGTLLVLNEATGDGLGINW